MKFTISMALCIFAILCSHHYHPPPEFFQLLTNPLDNYSPLIPTSQPLETTVLLLNYMTLITRDTAYKWDNTVSLLLGLVYYT